ncbi:gag-polypeptide of LTR copia-type [Sesbania bispinosa]|nr:gag-polypeptide of LTR copia-type [Sesbania bispinosa]
MTTSKSSTNSGPFSGVFTSTPAIATEKLLGSSNYLSWSKAMEKWCIGQGLKKHLYTKLENVNEDKENWEKTDALLCTLLWQSIDPSLHNIYTNFDTCYDLWTQAKSLYTNDIQRLYFVVEKLINSRQQNMTVSEIVGHMSSIKAEYNALLPTGKTVAEDLAQRDKFFMVCTLAILNTDLVSVRDQILASPSIPTLDEVFSRLLRVASIPPSGLIPNAHDTSALISTNAQHGHREEQGGPYRGGNKTSRPKCTYCHRWGHTKEKCFKLHGRPPRANLAHIDDTLPEQPRDLPVQQSVTLTGTDYDDYLSSSRLTSCSSTYSYCGPTA